jgi:hypothetical protein
MRDGLGDRLESLALFETKSQTRRVAISVNSLHCAYTTCYNIHNTKSNDRLVSILRKGLLRFVGHFGAFLLRSMQN